ncbi:MAG: kynureninase [Streptosporangiales bacterium]|nr:kynureninase [Streptosporangiales bacterium]
MSGVDVSAGREQAEALDAADPVAAFRDRFVVDDDSDLVYLDGNSLGRLPKAVAGRLDQVVRDEWGHGLIRSWDDWIDAPAQAGEVLGRHLLGARPDEVLVCDSVTVNLYKLAAAAARARPERRVIVTDDDNFPTDRYVLAGLAEERGLELRLIHADIDAGLDLGTLAAAVDDDTALVCLSQVAYRSGALLDMAEVTRIVHDAGALVIWDLCHSVGAVPIELDAVDTDLAVGCTYKYLNAGPGAPAFCYVRRDFADSLRQPIWGWFGGHEQFEMGPTYRPADGMARFLTGTPPIAGIRAVQTSAELLAEAGIGALRAKGVAMTEYLVALADAWLEPLGFRLASPRDPAQRGSHVTLHHPEAWRICQALIQRAKVIPDYRTPDRLRLGPAPIYTRYVDVWDGLDRLRRVVEDRVYEEYSAEPTRVT